ncbi:MAG: rhamnogalacturonan acetylesterase [Dysgonomonas sp.]|nr:rhamnogalacturonan acetylesterase [Dysgonomonas sp.]
MKKTNKYILTALLSFFCFSAIAQVRILTIGDSTMADYDEEKRSGENEMRGWAQMLPTFVKENVTVDNRAKNGRSSKSFYYEFWETLRETLKPGDYVFIQFGHNDEKADGLDTDPTDKKARGTAAWGQYQEYLTRYVNESRERGAIPVLMTPVVRRLFDEENKNIIGKGLHNLTDIALDDSTMNYPLAMRSLARKLSVPLIDMTVLTENLVKEYGAEKSKEVIYAKNDNTHLKAMGGVLFSELAVRDLLRQDILMDYLYIPHDLVIKTTTSGKQSVIIPQGGENVFATWEPGLEKKLQLPSFLSYNGRLSGLKYIHKKDRILITTPDNKWPAGDIDVNASRYVELEVSTHDGDLYIENVSFSIGSENGKEMMFTALGSTDKNFANSHTFALMENLPKDETKVYKSDKIIKVVKGEQLYIRIYPWYKTQSTNKYLYISDISIKGQIFK